MSIQEREEKDMTDQKRRAGKTAKKNESWVVFRKSDLSSYGVEGGGKNE